MLNSYYQTTGAMVTQFNRLDVVSNNLAKVNTTAFKKERIVVGDFERLYQETRDELPLQNHTKEAAKFLNRTIDRVPQISEKYVNYESGGLRESGNPLDFALKREDLFFLVETPDGVKMTQDGQFSINDESQLVTKDGYRVLQDGYLQNGIANYITIPENSILMADKNGQLYTQTEDNITQDPTDLAKLMIAQAVDMKRLIKDGDNLYELNDTRDLLQLEDGDFVAHKFIEMSNVNPVDEMVSLIEVNRFVQMYQKVMLAHMDDLNKEAVTKLAVAKA
jgi:flagellar basal-body rod protein FlgF